MWIFLGGLSAIVGLFVALFFALWTVSGVAGLLIGLLLLGAVITVLFGKSRASPRRQTPVPPLPAAPDRQSGAVPQPVTPSNEGGRPVPLSPCKPAGSSLPLPESHALEEQAGRPLRGADIAIKPQRQQTGRPREPGFELIPYKMSGINVRAVLPEENWRQLSRMVIQSHAGQCCECSNTRRTRMECHEVWEYAWELRPGRRNKVGVMRLSALRPLCHLCHMGKHIRFATSRGELPQVRSHLMALYEGLTEERLQQLIAEAVANSKLKYKYEELDLTYLNDARFAWLHEQIGRRFGTNEMPHAEAAGRALSQGDLGSEPIGEPLQ